MGWVIVKTIDVAKEFDGTGGIIFVQRDLFGFALL